jgi:predicted Rdx family selenoprotein
VRDHLQKKGAAKGTELGIELRPGKSGQFDVTVDGALAYTRSKTGRFPTDDEIEDLVPG